MPSQELGVYDPAETSPFCFEVSSMQLPTVPRAGSHLIVKPHLTSWAQPARALSWTSEVGSADTGGHAEHGT